MLVATEEPDDSDDDPHSWDSELEPRERFSADDEDDLGSPVG